MYARPRNGNVARLFGLGKGVAFSVKAQCRKVKDDQGPDDSGRRTWVPGREKYRGDDSLAYIGVSE